MVHFGLICIGRPPFCPKSFQKYNSQNEQQSQGGLKFATQISTLFNFTLALLGSLLSRLQQIKLNFLIVPLHSPASILFLDSVNAHCLDNSTQRGLVRTKIGISLCDIYEKRIWRAQPLHLLMLSTLFKYFDRGTLKQSKTVIK